MGLPGWEDAATRLVKPSVILLPRVANLFCTKQVSREKLLSGTFPEGGLLDLDSSASAKEWWAALLLSEHAFCSSWFASQRSWAQMSCMGISRSTT